MMRLVADRIAGTVELWDGWRPSAPNACMVEPNAGGSWSAWDALHTIDVQIATTTGARDGRSVDAATMLGRSPTTHGPGWIGSVEELSEADDNGLAWRYAITAAADTTLLSRWVASRDRTERAWGERVLTGITFAPPKRGLRATPRR